MNKSLFLPTTILFLAAFQMPASEQLEIKIINASNNAIINSGFLVGTSSGQQIKSIEVVPDKLQAQKAEGVTVWKYKLPTVRDGWKNKESRSFSIRGLGETGEVLLEKTILLTRGKNLDINGDGFADMVMGDHLYDHTRGAIFVYHGDKQGIKSDVRGKKADMVFKEKNTGGHFGKTIVIEDFNQDGYGDVVASHFDQSRIEAYVYNGSINGINTPVVINVLNDQNKAGYFGVSFLVGDLSLKGFFKLLVQKITKKKKENIPVEINK